MHRPIDTILRRLRQDVAQRLEPDPILAACREAGHVWRKSTLDPVAILHWFLIQILHGNTSLEHVARLAGGGFTGAAYCMARASLPLAVFQSVLREVIKALVPDTHAEGLWRGHRTFLVDGSAFSMPDTPELRERFGQPGAQAPGCGFPVAKILASFHAGTGVLLKVIVSPLRSHEMASVEGVHAALRRGDILVGDRGLCSFAHLAMLAEKGAHAVFRMHQRQIVDFTPGRPHARPGEKRGSGGRPRSRWLRGLGPLDQVVEWLKPEARPEWMTAERHAGLPASLIVRELRYRVARPGFRTRELTLVTTLVDAERYPPEALAGLYGARWRVELNFRHLKTTMKMDVLKCKTVAGVLKELAVYAIVYNLVRVAMVEASRRQRVDVERISFVDALRWLAAARAGDDPPRLVTNPERPGRIEPRVRKRRPKQYPLMREPRAALRNRLMTPGVSA
jgi:hypothetical protein